MARTMCGIWVCDISGSQWRRHWEDPCSSCEAKESGDCPGGIFDDDDDDPECIMRDFIEKAITTEVVKNYLLADFGNTLGVYPDGKVVIGQDVGRGIDPDDRPITTVECPGIGNIDGFVYENRALRNDPELKNITTEKAIELLSLEEDQNYYGLENDRLWLVEKLLEEIKGGGRLSEITVIF